MARVTFVTIPEGGQVTLSRMMEPVEYSAGIQFILVAMGFAVGRSRESNTR